MGSWLKAAEDLFEVVDRRAKLVVRELGDEQPESSPIVTGKDVRTLKRKPKKKGQSERARPESRGPSDTVRLREKDNEQFSASNGNSNKAESLHSETKETILDHFVADSRTELSSDNTIENNLVGPSAAPLLEAPESDANESVSVAGTNQEGLDHEKSEEAVASSESSNAPAPKESPVVLSPTFKSKTIELENGEHQADGAKETKLADEEPSLKTEAKKPENARVEMDAENVQAKSVMEITEESALKKQQHEKDPSVAKVQDQLDEAQGLLKIATSTGQSKEARLARVCAGLSSRLQEYKSENAQLEELLVAERDKRNSCEAQIRLLQQDLAASRTAISRVESEMADALSSKNAEINDLSSTVDSLKKQASASEGKLASLQADMETVMRSRELTETRMMQALREELVSAERKAEEERAAHNATKMAFMEREVELERRAVEASTALSRLQRIADERTSKTLELENKISMLEAECASLSQELNDVEARARRGQKKSPEEANKALQAWQEEAERARQGQREAESKLSSLEAEMQKMRVEMAGMRRDAEHYSRQEHMELEKRYRELTDLLYLKQTQLETVASEKAAAEFQLEKEVKRLREAQVEVERSKALRRASTPWEEETDVKALESLPLHHRHMVGASMQLQKAAKFLDSGAVRATKFLWRYPVARIILLFYLVFVHVFLLYLLHRLQDQADNYLSSQGVTDPMGLVKPELP
ncbi:golgin candidate 1 [Nymphaea colorata]|nr:golgin candidate 1 [Nymphaea colorata]